MLRTHEFKNTLDLRQNLFALFCLFLLTILIRFPFFFKDVIDWDEGTFILMGQSILDGHLPYTKLWDVKPPIAFASYALFIATLGKSIVSIRLAGALCITITAFFNYLVGRIWSYNVGILSGIFTISLISLLPGGQSTMTEMVALVPMMAAFYLLATRIKETTKQFLFVGLFLATATMVRLNLAYVSLIIGFLILIFHFVKKRSWRTTFKYLLAYGTSQVIIIFITFLPYLYSGEAKEWWYSVVLAPLSYANSRASEFQALKAQLHNLIAIHVYETYYLPIGILTWVAALIGMIYALAHWKQFSPLQCHAYLITLVFGGATALSILRGGATFTHYMMQLVPFVSLLSAIFLEYLIHETRFKRVVVFTMVLALMAGCYPLFLGEYQGLLGRMIKGQQLLYGSSYEIADYITQNRRPGEPIYMMRDHIVYWLIDAEPISKCTTHPSIIGKEYLLPYCADGREAKVESEMAYVLNHKPQFIVKKESIDFYLEEEETALELLKNTLNTNYKLVKMVNDRQIYERLK